MSKSCVPLIYISWSLDYVQKNTIYRKRWPNQYPSPQAYTITYCPHSQNPNFFFLFRKYEIKKITTINSGLVLKHTNVFTHMKSSHPVLYCPSLLPWLVLYNCWPEREFTLKRCWKHELFKWACLASFLYINLHNALMHVSKKKLLSPVASLLLHVTKSCMPRGFLDPRSHSSPQTLREA